MTRFRSYALVAAALALALGGCKDPAKGKPKAKTGKAKAEPMGARSGAEVLKIDPKHSKIAFVGSKVTGSHDGEFKRFSGSISTVDGKAESARIQVAIEMASVVSDNAKLTGHLKSGDFFDVKNHPKASFVSTKIKPGGAKGASHTITGNLTLRGVKKSISFPAHIKVSKTEVEAKSEFVLNRFDFNIVYKGMADNLIRNGVVIKLNIKAPRKG